MRQVRAGAASPKVRAYRGLAICFFFFFFFFFYCCSCPISSNQCKNKMCIVARKKENAQQALNIVQTIISIVQDFYPVLDDMGHPVRPYRIALGIAPYITISGAQLNAYVELLALRLFELGHGNHFASIRKEVNAAAAHQLYFVLPSAEDM